ncbi:WD40-repeat-containing domain [Pseudocohnilembus persalinus]|uniref:WD40-repeat-containing domain n=1 Tax=Pseudocohnilembus persalinus TaxID=266149 RepID=A0A0V0R8X9_PSEPJ|nr:WD40-repeat-containing domain [Pseudocohnilembus persalinus]|eukprot:KRX10943.1 WD40-repeat-containing domain [Pseudocohnilembus persalinus]
MNDKNQTPMYLVFLSFMQKEGLPQELISGFIEHIQKNKKMQPVITSDGEKKEMNLIQSQIQNQRIGVDVDNLLQNFQQMINLQANQNFMLNTSNRAQNLRPERAKNLEKKIRDKFLDYIRNHLDEENPPNFRRQMLKSLPKHKLIQNKKNTFQLSNFVHFQKLKNIMGHAYSQSSGIINSENEEPFIPVQALTYDKSGQFLFSADSEGLIKVFSSQTGLLLNNFKGHTKAIYVIEISPCNRYLLSCSSDTTARIWDFYDGRPLAVLKGETDDPFGSGNWFKIEDQLFLVISSDKGYVYIYREEDFINNMGVLNDEQFCLKLKMPWKSKVINGKIVNQDKNEVYNIQCHPQGYLTICLESGEIYVYEKLQNFHKNSSETRRQIKKYENIILDEHQDCCKVISWNPSGNILISASKDGTCKFWKWNPKSLNDNKNLKSDFQIELNEEQILFKNENRHKKNYYTSECSSIAWSLKGNYVIITFYKQPKKNNDYNDIYSFMCIYSMKENKILHWLSSQNTPLKFTDVIWIIEPHPLREEVVLSADESGQIAIWDIKMGVLLNTFQEKGYAMKWPQLDLPILDARFNPSGQQFAVCTSFGTLSIYGLGNSDFYKICPTEQFFASDTEPFAVQENLRITTIEVEDTDLYEMDRGRICDQEREPYTFEFRNLIPKLQQDGYFDTEIRVQKNIRNQKSLPKHLIKEEEEFYNTIKKEIVKNKEKDQVYEKEMLFYQIQRKGYILNQVNSLKKRCIKSLEEYKIQARIKMDEYSEKDKEYLKSYQNEVQQQEEQNQNNNNNNNNNQSGNQRRQGRNRNRLVRLGSQGQINPLNSEPNINIQEQEDQDLNLLEEEQEQLENNFQNYNYMMQQESQEDSDQYQANQYQGNQNNIKRNQQQQQQQVEDDDDDDDILLDNDTSSEVINIKPRSRVAAQNQQENNQNLTRNSRNQGHQQRNQNQNQNTRQQRQSNRRRVIDSEEEEEQEEEKEFEISDKDISEEFEQDEAEFGEELEQLEDELEDIDDFSDEEFGGRNRRNKQKKSTRNQNQVSSSSRLTRSNQRGTKRQNNRNSGQKGSGGKYSKMVNQYDSEISEESDEEYNSSRKKKNKRKSIKKNQIYSNDESDDQSEQDLDVEEEEIYEEDFKQSGRKTRNSNQKKQNQQQNLKRKKNMAIDSDEEENDYENELQQQSEEDQIKQSQKLKKKVKKDEEDDEDFEKIKPQLKSQKSFQQQQQQLKIQNCKRCELASKSHPRLVFNEHQNDEIIQCQVCENNYHVYKCAKLRGIFKDSQTYYCFNCKANKDMNKKEVSKSLRNKCFRSYLNSSLHDEYRILPQLGEEVYFILQGYEQFLLENFEILNYKILKKKYQELLEKDENYDIIMPSQNYQNLYSPTLCKVEEITYEFPSVQKKNSEKYQQPPIFMLLKLSITDNQQQKQMENKYFYVYYTQPKMDMKANFLINKQQFLDSIQNFEAIQLNETIYCGHKQFAYQIKNFGNFDAAFPESDYMRIIIEPIQDNQQGKKNQNQQNRQKTRNELNDIPNLSHISPWDMKDSYINYFIGNAFNSEEVKSILDLLNSFKKHRNEVYTTFEEKVDTKLYSDYEQVIQVPMEVSTFFNRIYNYYYRTREQALHDIDLIRSNAQEYNDEQSEIYDMAGEFAKILKEIVNEFHNYDKIFPKLFASEEEYEEYMGINKTSQKKSLNKSKKEDEIPSLSKTQSKKEEKEGKKSKKKQQQQKKQQQIQKAQSQLSENSQQQQQIKKQVSQQKQQQQEDEELDKENEQSGRQTRRTRQLQKPNYKEQDENNIPYRESKKKNSRIQKLSNASSHNLVNSAQLYDDKQMIKQQIQIKKSVSQKSSNQPQQMLKNQQQNLDSYKELTVEELQKKLMYLQGSEQENEMPVNSIQQNFENQEFHSYQNNYQMDQSQQQSDQPYILHLGNNNNNNNQDINLNNFQATNYEYGPSNIHANYDNSNTYISNNNNSNNNHNNLINNNAPQVFHNSQQNFQQNGVNYTNDNNNAHYNDYHENNNNQYQNQIYYEQVNSQNQNQNQNYQDDIQDENNINVQMGINYSDYRGIQQASSTSVMYGPGGAVTEEINQGFSTMRR